MPDTTDDIRTKAVAAAARLLVELLEPAPAGPVVVAVTLSEGTLDIQIQVRTHRESAPDIRLTLRRVHRRLLEVATARPLTAKRLASLAGYAHANSYVRGALTELVRWGLLRHTADGYATPAS